MRFLWGTSENRNSFWQSITLLHYVKKNDFGQKIDNIKVKSKFNNFLQKKKKKENWYIYKKIVHSKEKKSDTISSFIPKPFYYNIEKRQRSKVLQIDLSFDYINDSKGLMKRKKIFFSQALILRWPKSKKKV